jgi:hypothetical protein
LHVL